MEDAEVSKSGVDQLQSHIEDSEAAPITFEVSSFDELNRYLEAHYEETTSHFVIHSSSKSFGAPISECQLNGHGIVWTDSAYSHSDGWEEVSEDGIPRMIIGKRYMQCHFGKDRDGFRKKKRKQQLAEDDGFQEKKIRILKTPTKKFGCPARINIRQIIRFPEFKINQFTKNKKGQASKKLRRKLIENRSHVKMELAFVGQLLKQHKYHDVQQDVKKEPIDDNLRVKICELYVKKYTRAEISAELEKYVANELFYNQETPPQWRRRYHPTGKDVSNTILRFVQLANFSSEQEVQMTALIARWMAECKEQKIYFTCECGKEETNNSTEDELFESDTETNSKNKKKKIRTLNIPHRPYLFCYQNFDQQRLLRRYAGATYFLRCTDRERCKKIIPFYMYVLVQQTNVDYQIVGVIVTSKLRRNGLSDGLSILKDWNPSWKPTHFITDCDDVTQESLETVFPDARIFLSTHSCEQKWEKFISTPSNNLLSNRAEIMSHLRKMMYSFTEESLTEAATLLEGTDVWKSSNTLRDWFQSNWLHIAKNWVLGYRPHDIVSLRHFDVTIKECLEAYENLLICFDGKKESIKNTIENIVQNVANKTLNEYKTRNDRAFVQSKKNLFSNRQVLKKFPTAILPICHGLYTVVRTFPDKFQVTMKASGEFTVACSNDQNVDFNVESQNESSGNVANTEINEEPGFSEDCLANGSITHLNPSARVILPEVIVDEAHMIAADVPDFIGFNTGVFDVSFGDPQNSCFCLCSFWHLFKLPCLHMLAVFHHFEEWQYDMLSPLYRTLNCLEIDYCCVTPEARNTDQQTPTVSQSHSNDQDNPIVTPASSSNAVSDRIVSILVSLTKNNSHYESAVTTLPIAKKEAIMLRSKQLTQSIEQLRSHVENKQLYDTVMSDWQKVSKKLEMLS